ncbi:MAG TPA: 1-acyl-sn-glycerol-3-phosphate acyltransferase [Rhodospirillaceae bacterium]|nr:1-acyl-sn-glycerol-3-phosphate acyltransferase [Rhodospirillaceae bacterium]
MHNPLVAGIRFGGWLGLTLCLLPVYGVALGCKRKAWCSGLAILYWRALVRVVGFEVVVKGTASPERPTLFVSNHASYFDIVVLGSLLPAYFVAKKEVGQWPGIGFLARIARTVFVDRRPRRSLDQRDEMVNRLAVMKDSLVLFPEGTSSDGSRVLPFKSALLSVAEAPLADPRGLAVQPVSVAYTRLDGMPMGRHLRPFFAWYGGMELVPHLWTALGLGRTTVEVRFHTPVRLADFGSRRALADHCHQVVNAGVVAANTGRGGPG